MVDSFGPVDELRQYPIRGSVQSHIDWFLQKNPAGSLAEAEDFAKRQIGLQIGLSAHDIRHWKRLIAAEEKFVTKMQEELNAKTI